jgi:hypothetical protein
MLYVMPDGKKNDLISDSVNLGYSTGVAEWMRMIN